MGIREMKGTAGSSQSFTFGGVEFRAGSVAFYQYWCYIHPDSVCKDHHYTNKAFRQTM